MEKVDVPENLDETAPSPHRIQLPREWRGERLDRALTRLFGGHSRAEIQEWLAAGRVVLEGRRPAAKTRVAGGEWVVVDPPAAEDRDEAWVARPVPLDVVHADEHLIVLAKDPGRVVHPAAGHMEDTLVNGLLYRFPELAGVERAGIVHRLDRDTSGLLVVARTPHARERLVAQFKEHAVDRRYLAVVQGEITSGGHVEAPIGRHPRHRTKFAVVEAGKHALTHYRVERRYAGATRIEARLETGRTHQVRVHMAHIGHPVLGDPLYGGKRRFPGGLDEAGRAFVGGFSRQALHAGRLTLSHPVTGQQLTWEQPPPADMARLLAILEDSAT
ncbi:RluA family pseudouridine synthase [Thiohalorhabdus methylotrophus]|uniref:Pseudouridine synthase n=1 Tax=Thiohalorhabdus methylotrophus TaxID=3242694 RepID=A0ABV4TVQ6_9GAMM